MLSKYNYGNCVKFKLNMSFRICLLLLILFSIHITDASNFDREYSRNIHHRKLLSDGKQSNSSKHSHNTTRETKVSELKSEESMAGTEAAVLIIVVIVVLSVIGMVVYFVRKFDQLNRSLPTYRYSSLKTEINGIYGPDDKTESQVLVSVSTEEEDDFDDEEEDNLSPPTLLVKSQTVMPNKSSNGSVPTHHENKPGSEVGSKSEETTMDSDDKHVYRHVPAMLFMLHTGNVLKNLLRVLPRNESVRCNEDEMTEHRWKELLQ